MSIHVGKQVGVVFAMAALPLLVLVAPLVIVLIAAFFSRLSMPLP